jgi:hypothetical protein
VPERDPLEVPGYPKIEQCGKIIERNELLRGLYYNEGFVFNQLTTMYMKEFNEKVVMDDRVYCQSLYTTMNNIFDDILFRYTYSYINGVIGANDGIVSAYSAQWGDNVVKIEGKISHAEILDIKKRKISGKDIPGIYIGIVKGLSEKGF